MVKHMSNITRQQLQDEMRQGTQMMGVEESDEVEDVLAFMCETESAEMCETWKAPEPGEEAAPKRQLNFYGWDGFCKSARMGNVTPTVIIDFPYADQGGLDLAGDQRLLERMYVFKDTSEGDGKRVVLHVHTPLRWGERGGVTLQERVKKVTSVNVRHAVRGAERFEQEQGKLKMPLVPLAPQLESGWRDIWRAGDGSFEMKCTWLWQKAESMPTVEDKRVAARNYDQVRKIIKLGEGVPHDEKCVVETESWAGSEKAMRGGEGGGGGGKGAVEYEVVSVKVNASNAARVDPSGVVVHSAHGVAPTLQILRDIQQASARGASAASGGGGALATGAAGATRKLENDGEFKELVARVKKGAAAVVLRKMFLYTGSARGCTVSQEIWIEDKGNPAARNDPLKEYTVLHVHHHAGKDNVGDIVSGDLTVVDAVNARHLAAAGSGSQRDNPFFSTFIEPSGGDTLKVFPAKQWVCGKCGQNNFQMYVRCRGGKPGKCGATRTCTRWGWKQHPNKDAGLAEVLTLAEQAVAWPSRSKKDRQRGGGREDGAEEFVLGELMALYGEHQDVAAESLSGVQAVSEAAGSTEAGKSFQETRVEGGGDSAGSDKYFEEEESFKEEGSVLDDSARVGTEGASFGASCEDLEMQVEAGPRVAEAGSEVVSKTVSRGTERPDPPPSPFSVLFAGANAVEQTKLNLEEEFRQLRTAFLVARGEESWEGLVHFERDCFASPSSVMDKLSGFKPTVLHLGCHGETTGVHLTGGFLENERLAEALLQLNKRAGVRRIRLVVANACMSGKLALLLTGGIEFVIAHGDLPVGDAEAIKFSHTLYHLLGRGNDLLTSFMAASLESKPYELLSPRFDPEQFFLRNEIAPEVRQTDVSELISFVGEEGVKEILRRLREDPRTGLRAGSNLERILASDAAAKEWVSGISETASTEICLKVMADAMSDAETDEERSELGDFPESRGEPGGCWTILGVRHEGSVANFQQHMRGLVGEFVFSEQRGVGACATAPWSLCELLLLAFMRHADFALQSDSAQQWLDLDDRSTSETDRLDCFTGCLLSDSFKHPFLDEWRFSEWMWGCSKKHRHVGAVFVLDQMVRRFLFDEDGVGGWARDVVHGWFDTVEDSQGFLDRANKYLGERASVIPKP
ncbi:hypothetical protein T484DRAFT_1796551 [Baffinella frigidus]|nr:hypothetical protein T484DRAFT_1796551 [Cryptophyta sp. CCMP2293]